MMGPTSLLWLGGTVWPSECDDSSGIYSMGPKARRVRSATENKQSCGAVSDVSTVTRDRKEAPQQRYPS